jgi:rare lipoprotein A
MSVTRPATRGLYLVLLVGAAFAALLAVGAPAAPPERPRVQHGLASFYGPGFHLEETASGEIFNQWKMVAAHRTLPLGTVVRVTNLENRRQVILRVIDRGPYGRNVRKGAIVDVSLGAARKLGFVRDGLTRVRLEVLDVPDERRSARRPAGL